MGFALPGGGAGPGGTVHLADRPVREAASTPPLLARGPRCVAEVIFPDLLDWREVLDRLGVPAQERIALAARSQAERQTLPLQVVADGAAGEEAFFQAFAAELGVGFEAGVEAGRLALREEEAVMHLAARRRGTMLLRGERNGPPAVLAAPMGTSAEELRPIVGRAGLRERLRLVTPSAARQALWERAAALLSRRASLGLFERAPHLSARFTLVTWQALLGGAALVALPLLFWFFPAPTLLGLHLAATLFFAGCVALRVLALLNLRREGAKAGPEPEGDLPVYSVLVALYREAAVVPQLVAALSALDWPAGRLDVKLVCEADDRETIEAIRRARPPPHMEIVAVPPGSPRTKPKALNYALPGASGAFVVLYDAEDRPHPGQLREAWKRFAANGPDLACLQAPLVVTNGGAGYLSRMFGFEYAALFRGLLPYLSRQNFLLPLGGTSNHFRRECLEAAGGWDPFNVTEDADLALRLKRSGYRTETLGLPTWEDAPEGLRTWMPQRARWFKGWMQCLLVHSRSPSALWRELGGALQFAVAQMLLAGLIFSALAHPLLAATFATLLVSLLDGAALSPVETALVALDALNIFVGYLSFLLLGWRVCDETERRGFLKVVLGTPVYWMLISAAAWTALWQLWRRPHHWNKTPHSPARTKAPS